MDAKSEIKEASIEAVVIRKDGTGRASAAAANEKDKTLANLAEEAANLGLELLEGGK
jgi:hypothetical protein